MMAGKNDKKEATSIINDIPLEEGKEKEFLKLWESLKFDSLSTSPTKKADNLRKLMFQLKNAAEALGIGKNIESDVVAKIECKLQEKYSDLIEFRLPFDQKLQQHVAENSSSTTNGHKPKSASNTTLGDIASSCPKKELSKKLPDSDMQIQEKQQEQSSSKLDQTVPESKLGGKSDSDSGGTFCFKFQQKSASKSKTDSKPKSHHENSPFLSGSVHLAQRKQKRAHRNASSSDEEESANSRKKRQKTGGGKISSYKRKPIKSVSQSPETEKSRKVSSEKKVVPKFQQERNFAFASARQQLEIDGVRKGVIGQEREEASRIRHGKYMGQLKIPPVGDNNRQFKPPTKGDVDEGITDGTCHSLGTQKSQTGTKTQLLEPKLLDIIESEIMVRNLDTNWEDIAGLESAKDALKEIVVWPFLRPDLFCGLRAPPKGVLLFGPPGTGKTMIGKCIASECEATFFNISASTLTSKWVGEGEKLVRALFQVARQKLPAVVFIDEVDSLLSARCDSEHESSRRMKTEFLVQMDGLDTNAEERLLVLGATNSVGDEHDRNEALFRPGELDEAVRRRFSKRLYIPLPDGEARKRLITHELKKSDTANSLSEQELDKIRDLSDGYSCADLKHLCRDASMWPIRCLKSQIRTVSKDDLRPVCLDDFENSLKNVKATVSVDDLGSYVEWNEKFGVVC